MFWTTGQNRTSWRRSSASTASQRLGPRGAGGGGKNSACGTLARGSCEHPCPRSDAPSAAAIVPTVPDRGIRQSVRGSGPADVGGQASYGQTPDPTGSRPADSTRLCRRRPDPVSLLHRSLPIAAPSRSIAIRVPSERPDADPGGQPDLLIDRELPDVRAIAARSASASRGLRSR